MALRSPSPSTVIGAILMVSIPLTLAWLINRALRRARPAGCGVHNTASRGTTHSAGLARRRARLMNHANVNGTPTNTPR